jgi:hypothetical protein
MDENIHIPMFPLAILPLPGELVPLHIFEPRYRQLLQDIETNDTPFGIYFNQTQNEARIGSLVRLESVIKRYPGGESDIIVKCLDIFTMGKLMRTFGNRMYPGGDVQYWNVDSNRVPSPRVYELFVQYFKSRQINEHAVTFNLYQMANELSLELSDRYKFLRLSDNAKEIFLLNRLQYQLHLLDREKISKNVYHLN